VYCSEIAIGDLVCLKSWRNESDDYGWISFPTDYGIVIEIIEVTQEFTFIDRKIRCYDFVIFWVIENNTEQLPDVIIEKYTDWNRRRNEK